MNFLCLLISASYHMRPVIPSEMELAETDFYFSPLASPLHRSIEQTIEPWYRYYHAFVTCYHLLFVTAESVL